MSPGTCSAAVLLQASATLGCIEIFTAWIASMWAVAICFGVSSHIKLHQNDPKRSSYENIKWVNKYLKVVPSWS